MEGGSSSRLAALRNGGITYRRATVASEYAIDSSRYVFSSPSSPLLSPRTGDIQIEIPQQFEVEIGNQAFEAIEKFEKVKEECPNTFYLDEKRLKAYRLYVENTPPQNCTDFKEKVAEAEQLIQEKNYKLAIEKYEAIMTCAPWAWGCIIIWKPSSRV